MKKTLLVMGGDRRMEYAADALAAEFDVYTYGFSNSRPIWELKQADILVLPYFSLSGEYLNAPQLSHKVPAVSALDMLRYGGTLFGGGLSDEFLSYCAERCAKVYDFFDDEDLTLKNADLTAEGALELVIKETDSAVLGSNTLILGFGRVGKACAKLFSAVGSEVSVAARSESARAAADELGHLSCVFDCEDAYRAADIVINTVPQTVLTRERLGLMKKDAMVLDLASAPYGTDFEAAKEFGIKALTAPGLPGKTAPKTAGKLIAESISRRVKEGERGG